MIAIVSPAFGVVAILTWVIGWVTGSSTRGVQATRTSADIIRIASFLIRRGLLIDGEFDICR